MPRLNETNRWRALCMIEAGVHHIDIARQFGVHQNTVDVLWRRYQQFGTTRDRLRSGHPRATSNCQDTYIWVACSITEFVAYRARLEWDESSHTWPQKSAVDVTWPVTYACEDLEWYSPGIFQHTCNINEASLPSMHIFQWWRYMVLMSWTVFRERLWKLISIQDTADAITMSIELVLNKGQIKPWYILCSDFLYTS